MSAKEARECDVYQEWLGAYADGELSAVRRAWVEAHLAECLPCREELAELRALTTLLHADPAPRPAQTAEAFAGQVARRLPGRARPWGRRLLRYAPLGLFGAWAFFQAIIIISGGLLFALNFSPFYQGQLALLLPAAEGGSPLPAWLAEALSLAFPGALPGDFFAVEWIDPLVLLNFVLLAVVAFLFLAWLAAYWSHRRARASVS